MVQDAPLMLLWWALVASGQESLLHRAEFNAPTWEAILAEADTVDRGRCLWLLEHLRPLDLMEMDEACIRAHLTGTRRASRAEVPEDMLLPHVLNPSTHPLTMVTDWRTPLARELLPTCRGRLGADIQEVRGALEWVQVRELREELAPPSPPEGVWARGVGTREEVAGLTVAALRSVGIPARLAGRGVEAWDGEGWRTVLADPSALPAEMGTVVLRLWSDGAPMTDLNRVGLARWVSGRWAPVEVLADPVDFRVEGTLVVITAPRHSYLVTAGARNSRGEPRVWCARVEVGHSDTLEADLSIPFEDLEPDDLVQAPFQGLGGVEVEDPAGRRVRVQDLGSGHGGGVVILGIPGQEATTRVVQAFQEREGELGVPWVTVSAEPRPGFWTDRWGHLWRAVGERGPLPVVVAVDGTGRVLLVQRAAMPRVADLVVSCLRRARREGA